MTASDPIIGGYTLTAPSATFIVETSVGQQQFTVRLCRNNATVEPYVVTGQLSATRSQSSSQQVWHQSIPQAACDAHCKLVPPPDPAGGDLLQFEFPAAPDSVLSNPREGQCTGVGCQFADSWAFSLIDPHTVRMQVRTRSKAFTVDVIADDAPVMTTAEATKLASGTLTWGQPFSILVPVNATGVYLTFEGVNYPLDSIQTFRVVSPRSIVGSNYNYTLERDDVCPA
jgi:hypothetical protein